MGKNRKLPFGYKMENGCVVIYPEEAKWVRYIFEEYASGASFRELTDYLKQKGISYEADKLWNKNMIARILEDARYQGAGGFPVIIDENVFQRAAATRRTKRTAVPKTEAQKMLRRKCGFPLTQHIESEVLYLLNSLAQNPNMIVNPKNEQVPTDRLTNLKNSLEDMLTQFPADEKGVQDKLMEIAAAMYEVIDPREYETFRMRKLFHHEEPRTELDANLIAMSISAVLVDSSGNVRIKLKNEQEIERWG